MTTKSLKSCSDAYIAYYIMREEYNLYIHFFLTGSGIWGLVAAHINTHVLMDSPTVTSAHFVMNMF